MIWNRLPINNVPHCPLLILQLLNRYYLAKMLNFKNKIFKDSNYRFVSSKKKFWWFGMHCFITEVISNKLTTPCFNCLNNRLILSKFKKAHTHMDILSWKLKFHAQLTVIYCTRIVLIRLPELLLWCVYFLSLWCQLLVCLWLFVCWCNGNLV